MRLIYEVLNGARLEGCIKMHPLRLRAPRRRDGQEIRSVVRRRDNEKVPVIVLNDTARHAP